MDESVYLFILPLRSWTGSILTVMPLSGAANVSQGNHGRCEHSVCT